MQDMNHIIIMHIHFVELLHRIYPETLQPSVNTSKEIIYSNQNEQLAYEKGREERKLSLIAHC